MPNLLPLAARCEAAPAEEQRELLIEAWDAVNRRDPNRPGQFAAWLAFERMLDAQAWESAALMLVPEGLEWSAERRLSKGMRPAYASIWSMGARDVDIHHNGTGRTPALAILAAALKAMEDTSDGQ